MTAPEPEASKTEAREAKQERAKKSHFRHPDGIVSAQDFFNYSSIAFSTGYLEAIQATDIPEQAAEFAAAAVHWAKDATDPRAKELAAACEEAVRAKFGKVSVESKTRKKTKRNVDPNDKRPTIRIVPGEIERIVNEAEAALIKANRGIYQRDGRIVSIGSAPAIAADETKITVQRIFERGEHALQEDLSTAAQFEKYDARSKNYVLVNPPMWIVKALRERTGRRRFPVLSGIINAPTMRADGGLLAQPGYDPASGLFFDPLGVTFPPIPDQPSRADAEEALTVLSDLIRGFPFVAEPHRAVALSAMLTALIRRSLLSAPMHAFTSPVAGSGKSLIVDTASTIATGSEAPVTAQGAHEEELEKRLGAHLLAGDSIIAIDNCSKPLGGDLLNQILTQQTARPRTLGRSEVPILSTGAFVAANGNNLVISGDLTRRAIICRLDAKIERPEQRTFDWNPVAVVKANRPAYVAAALTILRAYHVADRPGRPPPLGSFATWSDLVRGALMWLGCADPVATMEEIRHADPVLALLQMIMSAWRQTFGREQVTTAQVIKAAMERANSFDCHLELPNEQLREAILIVAGRGGAISNDALGKWLSKNKGRIVDGARFEEVGKRQGVTVWTLVTEKGDW
jgi:putative DNA primase/helicase